MIKKWPDDPEGWYQRGRVHAQMQRPDEALADLRQAAAKGFKDAERMKTDGALVPLFANEDFKKLLTALEEKRK